MNGSVMIGHRRHTIMCHYIRRTCSACPTHGPRAIGSWAHLLILQYDTVCISIFDTGATHVVIWEPDSSGTIPPCLISSKAATAAATFLPIFHSFFMCAVMKYCILVQKGPANEPPFSTRAAAASGSCI